MLKKFIRNSDMEPPIVFASWCQKQGGNLRSLFALIRYRIAVTPTELLLKNMSSQQIQASEFETCCLTPEICNRKNYKRCFRIILKRSYLISAFVFQLVEILRHWKWCLFSICLIFQAKWYFSIPSKMNKWAWVGSDIKLIEFLWTHASLWPKVNCYLNTELIEWLIIF